MTRKSKILIIIISALLLISIIVTLLFVFRKSDKNEYDVNSIENKTRQVLDSVNYINTLIKDQNFDYNSKYTNEENNLDCYKYIGENAEIYLNVIRTTYIKPFSSNGYFNLNINQNNEEELFVCKPKCKVKEIMMEDIKNKNETKDNITFTVSDQEFTLKNVDGIWKLNKHMVLCQDGESE